MEVEYLNNILSPLLAKPESLHLEKSIDERGMLISISVDHEDMGRLIGREGKNIETLRSIMRMYGSMNGEGRKFISLRVPEPPNSTHVRRDTEPESFL